MVFYAISELRLRQPAQLIMNLRRIDCVAHIMTFAVGYVRNQTLRLAQLFANQLDDINIAHLIMTADIVHLTSSAFMNNHVNCFQ